MFASYFLITESFSRKARVKRCILMALISLMY